MKIPKIEKHSAVQTIEQLFSEGRTYREIGGALGVSRQRIHQIAKAFGICENVVGGRKLKVMLALNKKKQKQIAKYGCTKEERDSIRKKCMVLGLHDPSVRFWQQKRNARTRGITWDLTFKQWWDIWEPYFHKRGRGVDEFVMCRNGDCGPYSNQNVAIHTASENHREWNKNRVCQAN